MAFLNTWRLCILLDLLSGILALGSLCHQEFMNDESLILLKEMGKPLTLRCSLEIKSLQVKALNLSKLTEGKQAEEKISIISQTLHHISKIFRMNMDSVTWPLEKVEHFRTNLDGHLRVMGKCVTKAKKSAIHKYFRQLKKFLKKKYSACAWEIIRTMVTSTFQQIRGIVGKMSKEN